MTTENLFRPDALGATEREEMDRDGHYVLPGILTEAARASLSQALQQIHSLIFTGIRKFCPAMDLLD